MIRNDIQRTIRWAASAVAVAGWAPILVFSAHVVASRVLDVYFVFPELDIPMHLSGGLAIAFFFGRSLTLSEAGELLGKLSALACRLFVFTATCSAAVLWEFAEWVSDRYFGTSAQGGLDDTLFDMLLGIVGGLLYLILARFAGHRPVVR